MIDSNIPCTDFYPLPPGEDTKDQRIADLEAQLSSAEAVLSRIATAVDEKARPWWLSKIIREWEDGGAK